MQVCQPAASRLHSKVLPDSLDEKGMLACGLLVGLAGLLSIAVCGGVVSTVQLAWAGVGSTSSPATALTANS